MQLSDLLSFKASLEHKQNKKLDCGEMCTGGDARPFRFLLLPFCTQAQLPPSQVAGAQAPSLAQLAEWRALLLLYKQRKTQNESEKQNPEKEQSRHILALNLCSLCCAQFSALKENVVSLASNVGADSALRAHNIFVKLLHTSLKLIEMIILEEELGLANFPVLEASSLHDFDGRRLALFDLHTQPQVSNTDSLIYRKDYREARGKEAASTERYHACIHACRHLVELGDGEGEDLVAAHKLCKLWTPGESFLADARGLKHTCCACGQSDEGETMMRGLYLCSQAG